MTHLEELDAGQGFQQLAWLLLDLLRMREVARVLVGDPHLHVALRLWQPNLGEPLGQIFHAAFELRVKVLHVSAAAGRVDDQRIELAHAERLHVLVAQPLRALEVAVVREQRAAAPLALRKPHLAACELQQPDRCLVRLGVQDGHHASNQERDAVLALADRRRDMAGRRTELLAQRRQHAAAAGDRREVQPLREPGCCAGGSQPSWMRDKLA